MENCYFLLLSLGGRLSFPRFHFLFSSKSVKRRRRLQRKKIDDNVRFWDVSQSVRADRQETSWIFQSQLMVPNFNGIDRKLWFSHSQSSVIKSLFISIISISILQCVLVLHLHYSLSVLLSIIHLMDFPFNIQLLVGPGTLSELSPLSITITEKRVEKNPMRKRGERKRRKAAWKIPFDIPSWLNE